MQKLRDIAVLTGASTATTTSLLLSYLLAVLLKSENQPKSLVFSVQINSDGPLSTSKIAVIDSGGS